MKLRRHLKSNLCQTYRELSFSFRRDGADFSNGDTSLTQNNSFPFGKPLEIPREVRLCFKDIDSNSWWQQNNLGG